MSKKCEEKGLFELLSITRNEYLSYQDEEKSVYASMNEELAEAERKIRLSYQEKINAINENGLCLKEQMKKYNGLLERFSTFDSQTIGNIIAQLVSFVEGEDYSYQESVHETYEHGPTVFGSESFKTSKKLLMIVKESKKQIGYYDLDEQNNIVLRLVKSGQAIVLSECEFDRNKLIKIYISNDGIVKCLIDFDKFSYAIDFINLVIQYRFESNLEKISEKDLLKIMNQFILSKCDMIEDNHKRRAKEKRKELMKQLTKCKKTQIGEND